MNDVKELKDVIDMPPPTPRRPSSDRGFIGRMLLTLGIVLGVLMFDVVERQPPPATLAAAPAQPPQRAPNALEVAAPRSDIDVVKNTWTRGGFDNVGIWTVTLRNRNHTVEYFDIKYRTTYAAASGTILSSRSGTIYQVLPPGATRTFRKLNDGFIPQQAPQAAFAITGAQKRAPAQENQGLGQGSK